MVRERPADGAAAAAVLADAAQEGRRVRPLGGGTKRGWGAVVPEPEVELSTAALDAIVAYDPGDLTAVLGAGLPLARAQEAFAEHGQALALDPPDGAGAATIGGVVASGDSGPWRHRHGAARDLVLGATVALPDGTLATTGSRVIKNVAGYDLAKLYAGSLGTLGTLVEVVVRLHPRPAGTATVVARGADPALVSAGAAALAAAPLELEALDVRWSGEDGAVLARAGGEAAPRLAARVARLLGEAGLDVEAPVADDEALWAAQRAGQRAAPGGMTLRVSGEPSRLADVLTAAREVGASDAVGRAAVGLTWIRLPAGQASAMGAAPAELRARLAPLRVVVQDAPDAVRAAVDVWGVAEGPALELMRRVKARFDPARACNPGVFAGGI